MPTRATPCSKRSAPAGPAARLRRAAAVVQAGSGEQALQALACVRAELPYIDAVQALRAAQWPLMACQLPWCSDVPGALQSTDAAAT